MPFADDRIVLREVWLVFNNHVANRRECHLL